MYTFFMHAPDDWRILKDGYALRDKFDNYFSFDRVQDAIAFCKKMNKKAMANA